MTAVPTLDRSADERRGGPLTLTRVEVDATATKLCLRTEDGCEIESVVVPMGLSARRQDRTWRTLCVSSQVGCRWGCTFCRTGRMGLVRDLTTPEIVAQVHAARTGLGVNVRNVVFMGMGEPLDNFENVVGAIRQMHEDRRHQIPRRRMTVSTAGRCEGIRRLGALGWRNLKLAVSLNAPNDEIRSRIMPINRREPMAMLREAIRAYPVRTGGHVLIEYVLLQGLNDHERHARELADYLRGLSVCVNLIAYNPSDGCDHAAPSDATIAHFKETLMAAGQMVFVRKTKGDRAMAACGQLGHCGRAQGDGAVATQGC